MAGSVNHVSLPTTEPTKSGCRFIGWNTKADGSGDSFTEATNVTSSMRVYAQWESGKDGTATTNPDPTPDPAPSHSSSSGHGSSSGRGSTTSSGVVIETGTQETKTPDQANALPAGTTENMLEEENTESALPKTGQEANPSAFAFFSSILLLLVTLTLKKKEN